MPQVGILGVKGIPYQGDQMAKIVDVLGTPEGRSLCVARGARSSFVDVTDARAREQSNGGLISFRCRITRNSRYKHGTFPPAAPPARPLNLRPGTQT